MKKFKIQFNSYFGFKGFDGTFLNTNPVSNGINIE